MEKDTFVDKLRVEEESKLKWVKPSVCAVKISKLTEGFGPNLKDIPVLHIGAS